MPKNEITTLFAVNPDSELFANKTQLGIECVPVKTRSTYDIAAVRTLMRYIKEYDIDIVSTHSGRDGWLGGMAAKFSGVACVRVRHLQTPFATAFPYKYLCDEVTAVSRGVKEYIVSRGVDERKVRVVYTGVDTAQFTRSTSQFREEFSISNETFLVGIVAIMRSEKRHIDLIKAVKQLSKRYDIKLAIVGDGPVKERTAEEVRALSADNEVIMTGFRTDTVAILSALDLFVLPSSQEALGTALLEAQSCGVPVVGSNIGGIPEAFDEGKSGLLFECENVDDLVAKIERFIVDRDFHARAAIRAREFIEEHFSVEAMVTQTLSQYRELLS